MNELYIFWNDTENRPMINRDSFGSLVVYLTEEQAKARMSDDKNRDIKVSIKKIKVTN